MKQKFLPLVLVFLGWTLNTMGQSSCPGFKTYTQGGWGASPSGNNAGTFLNNNFAANFPAPAYLTIGCTNKIVLTSATAVRAFLPNGTTPYVLPNGTLTNPTKNNFSNVLAGQLVALTLNLRFDNNIASFGSSSTNLRNLVIASGPFIGKTVQFLYDEANKRIGGCPAFNKTLSEYNTAIDNVNRNYDNGVIMGSFLVCPLTATCTTSPVLCNGGNSGSMTVTPNGGRAPFTYQWSGGVAGNVATAAGLAAGTYTVTVTDASLQTTTTTCTVNQPTLLVASASAGQILCNGGTTSATVSASGGVAPYSGTGTFTVGAGTYSYTVTDANGCTASTAASISEPSALTVSITTTERVSCNGSCNARLSASANGGTPAYSYNWSDGTNGSNAIGLCSGNYSVTATDANGCQANASVELDSPEILVLDAVLTLEDDNCGDDLCTGQASISAIGGELPYSYAWTGGESTTNSLEGLCEGAVVNVTVTDARGCSVSAQDASISCRVSDCGDHKTFTQGGWGANPNGNNAGVYLHANFSDAFPTGLTIGCGDNTLSFYSAQEITDFLPEGGTPSALPDLSVLTGQLVAASLNVGFDGYDADFAGSNVALGALYTDAEGFEGMTVSEILAAANEVIGGCSEAFGYSALNAVLTTINENFDNGTVDQGHLSCTPSYAQRRLIVAGEEVDSYSFGWNLFPNPASEKANLNISSVEDDVYQVRIFSISGALVLNQQVNVVRGDNNIQLNLDGMLSGTYLLHFAGVNQSANTILQVR
ncbi:MAG: T9SS type A sorting domain-containing protein [Flavobacteriales bacterium]